MCQCAVNVLPMCCQCAANVLSMCCQCAVNVLPVYCQCTRDQGCQFSNALVQPSYHLFNAIMSLKWISHCFLDSDDLARKQFGTKIKWTRIKFASGSKIRRQKISCWRTPLQWVDKVVHLTAFHSIN